MVDLQYIVKGIRRSSSLHNTMSNAGLGVPVKLLHESLGHIITVELKTGQLYRGKLAEGEFRVNDLYYGYR